MQFFTKKSFKEIGTWSRPRNNYLNVRNEENKTLYVEQKKMFFLALKIKKKKIKNLDKKTLWMTNFFE